MARNKGGRPRKYPDVGELYAKIEEYFAYCEANKKHPNKQGLAAYLGVVSDTLTEWANNPDGKYGELSVAIKKAYDRMSDLLQQRTDAMAIISLKQPCYGGFIDRPKDTQDIQINVKLKLDGA